VKYSLRPDLENRIREGSIRACFDTVVQEIRESTIVVRTRGAAAEIGNDWVLALTGDRPDYWFLERLNIDIADDPYRTPVYDQASSKRAVPASSGGNDLRRSEHRPMVHENGRFVASQIVKHITDGRVDPVDFDAIH